MIVFINCYEEMASGMRLLAAMAKEKGHDVHIIVLRGYKVKISSELDETNSSTHILVNGEIHVNPTRTRQFTTEELKLLHARLLQLNPELICVSTRSANDAIMPSILKTAKNAVPEAPIVCGGYGPTYAPEHYLRNGADLVVRGEGETAFPALLDNLHNGEPLTEISNTCFLRDGQVVCNPMAPPLTDITSLPSPLTGDEFVSFIDENSEGKTVLKQHDPAYDNETFCILVGRGCIGKCAYCAAPVQKGMYAEEGHHLPAYRRRSYGQVLRELEIAKSNGIRRVFFKDEYLVDDTARLTAFFREYKKRINLPFKANLHFGQLIQDPEYLEAVMEAGLSSLTLGFQAGTEAMAKKIYGRPHNFEDLKSLANIFYTEHIPVQYHFVSGTTLNTEEEFADKCRLISSLPYDPLLPWRTQLFDFQFFPQPRSKMTLEIDIGALRRIPVREWARQALRAQLYHFSTPEDAESAWNDACKQDDAVAFLLRKSEQLRKQAWEQAANSLFDSLTGKDILVMGDATRDFKILQSYLSSRNIKIKGAVGFPGFAAVDGRIAPEKVMDHFGAEIPLLFFGSAAYKYMSVMTRTFRTKNPLLGISVFNERFK